MRARVALSLCVLLAAAPVRAVAAPTGDASTYVSERFRKLAVRVAREVLAEELARSCSPGQPLCRPLAQRLGDAVGGAIEGDDQAVRAALNGLFLEASVLGLAQATVGEAWTGPKPIFEPVTLRPLVRCLAAGLTGRPTREGCSPAKGEADLLAGLFERLPCKGNDKASCAELVTRLREGQAVPPSLALRALAGLVTSDEVQRPDLRLLFLELASLTDLGAEGGLSPALLRYLVGNLSSTSSSDFAAQGLVDYAPGAPASRALWDDGKLAEWAAAAERCGQPAAPLDAWRRDRGGLLESWRRQVLLGQPVDLAPLEGLLGLQASCAEEADADRITELRRFVRYFIAPLRVHLGLVRYGAGALAAASALDHVRTRDAARLGRDLHRTLVYSVAALGRQRLIALALARESGPGAAAIRLQGKDLPWLGDALASCEVTALAALLGVTMPASGRHLPVPEGRCLALADGGLRPWPAPPVRPPSTPEAEWLRAQGPALQALLEPLLEDRAADLVRGLGGRPGDVDLAALGRVIAALGDGDEETARLVLLRAGMDLLAQHLERITADMVGASEAGCRGDLRARTVFSGLGAGCAVHALLTGAYRPVAEYYWAGGRDAEGLATAGYRGLLANQALRYTPVILNVGLGATLVTGRETQWGRGGYAALTVIDKLGLAFYKRLDERTTFECGVFAGGFLDALVRTAADSGKEHRYWLLGLTAGWPRLRGLDLGVEVHAGAAMPFEVSKGASYGFAAGAALVVPFETLLTE